MSFADKELSVASLASEAGFSEVYFRKLFLRRFGQSPSKYIMQTRVSHAIKLMEFDGLTLSEIAEECGFSSTPYFNRVFKAVTGESPAAYRRSIAKLPHIT
jgi:AraC family transcriptional regulator